MSSKTTATEISPDAPVETTFSELGLDDRILKALDEIGYKTPTPIQAQAIPHADLVIYDNVGHLPQEEAIELSLADVRQFMLSVELDSLDEEVIIPAGAPRLVGAR